MQVLPSPEYAETFSSLVCLSISYNSSILTLKIFAIAGLGNEFTLTITNRDYTALLGVLAFYCTFIVICNLVVDLLYVVVDPRIKLEG